MLKSPKRNSTAVELSFDIHTHTMYHTHTHVHNHDIIDINMTKLLNDLINKAEKP